MQHSALIVDDNPADVLLTRMALEDSGCYGDIIEAHDGESALALFRDHVSSPTTIASAFPPFAVFLDIKMLGMDGFEFLEALEALWDTDKPPRVICMLSSSDLPEDRERAARHARVKDYAIKPLTKERAAELAKTFAPLP